MVTAPAVTSCITVRSSPSSKHVPRKERRYHVKRIQSLQHLFSAMSKAIQELNPGTSTQQPCISIQGHKVQ